MLTFSGILNGAVQWVEKEVAALAPSAEADLAAAKAHLQPLIESTAQHLAAVLQTDGLKVVSSIVAAMPNGNVQEIEAAATGALQGMGKDLSSLSQDALHQAIAAAQAALPKQGS